MIGTKFYKPLQDDLLTKYREVEITNPVTGKVEKIQEPYTEPNPAPNTISKYAEAAAWSNASNSYIEDKGDYYEVVGVPEPTQEELQAQALAQAKAERAEAVSKITVEVDGMVFDGDETAQTRMGRTIAAAIALGVDIQTYTQVWVLADNTVANVTIAQLAQALKLAGEAQTALWTVPYTSEAE